MVTPHSRSGVDASPEEVVSGKGLHGDDSEALATIRRAHYPDGLNTMGGLVLPGLLNLYRRQHAAAWSQRVNAEPPDPLRPREAPYGRAR